MANFGTGTASGPLNFTSGQTVNVTGKYFNGAGGITVDSCTNIIITGCDFADGNGISLNNLTGSITLKNCRFRNPGVNAILIKNSTVHGYVSLNSIRGHGPNTVDYIRLENTGGVGNTDATLLKVEFNHIDGRDPVTSATSILANGGSGIFYGDIVTGIVEYISIISNTVFNAAQYGIHVDSGGTTAIPVNLYYNGLYCEKVPNSIAAIYLSRGAGTVGGAVSVSVHDLYWMNAAGALTPYLDDATLTTTYLSNVMLAVDLNKTDAGVTNLFGSGVASGPLNFTSGAVSVAGKHFNGAGGITISGCTNVSIQNCDFEDGNFISIDGSAGTILLSHCRFKNPPANAIKITNSTFTGTGVVHNSMRGRQTATHDYIYVGNSGGTSATAPLKIEYNHVDSSDPVTGLFSYPANGGSGIFCGAFTTPGAGFVNFIYNTMLNPGPYGFHMDSGTGISFYYDILFSQQATNALDPLLLSKGAGTLGGNLAITLLNLHWEDPSGNEVLSSAGDDHSLTVTYSQVVTIAVDLNAIVTS